MAYAPCKFSLRSVATPSRGFHHQFCIKRLQVKQNSSTVLEFFVSYFPSIMHLEISKYHKIISASNKVPTTPPPSPFQSPSPTPALYEFNVNKNFKLPVDLITECLKHKTCLLHGNKSCEMK